MAAWYTVHLRRRVNLCEVTRLYTRDELMKLTHLCGLRVAFQAGANWRVAMDPRPWLAKLNRLPFAGRALSRLYEFRLSTIEAILSRC